MEFKSGLLALALFISSEYAAALTFQLPENGDDIVGDLQIVRSRYEDTMAVFAEAYGIGWQEMIAANPGINPWVPGEGRKLILPTEFILPFASREGVVLNLAEYRLYYFLEDGKTVISYAMGIGREGWETPELVARVTGRAENPSWAPPPSIRAEHAAAGDPLPAIVPPGPDNPLGAYAVQLDAPGYFIHGTNKPFGVGMRVSHGCIRLYPEDIEEFVHRVRRGTEVRIVKEPIKAGWRKGALYLEVHQPLKEDRANWDGIAEARRVIENASQQQQQQQQLAILWQVVEEAVNETRGIPVRISD